MFLYRIHTKSRSCDADKFWLKEFCANHVCPGYGCGEIFPEARKRAIDIRLKEPPDISAVNVAEPPGVCIARRDFLALFGDEVCKYLKLGRVFLGDNTLLHGFVTFLGDRQILLRGAHNSRSSGRCKICGQVRYWPAYPWYIVKDCLRGQPLYESWPLDGLIITEELKARIEKGRWKGIYITKLPVLDEPRDGIPELDKQLVV